MLLNWILNLLGQPGLLVEHMLLVVNRRQRINIVCDLLLILTLNVVETTTCVSILLRQIIVVLMSSYRRLLLDRSCSINIIRQVGCRGHTRAELVAVLGGFCHFL